MKYIRLDAENIIREIIPEYDSKFPGVGIDGRYPADFTAQLIAVADDADTPFGYIYDRDTGALTAPPPPPASSADATQPSADDAVNIEACLLDLDYRIMMLEEGGAE